MQLQPYITQVQTQLAAAAALGDDATRAVADALAAAAEPAVRLALLAAVSAAADEITAALLDSPAAPRVAVRLDADDVRVEVHHAGDLSADADAADAAAWGGDAAGPAAAPAAGRPGVGPAAGDQQADHAGADDSSARITLRLPEALKGRIESAARSGGVSVNTWIVRAASAALSGARPTAVHRGNRLTGWINN
jgi:hypothetical protein